jgi:hypothetical protein
LSLKTVASLTRFPSTKFSEGSAVMQGKSYPCEC